jgi:uncharacterized protein (DUF1697 family)
MKKYIAFLRAINVGGTRVIKMDDLKRIFESFGMQNVQTYIQSGNVIFETDELPNLEERIETGLEKSLGFNVETFVRTMQEVAAVAKKSPFTEQGEETLFVSFVRRAPTAAARKAILALSTEIDSFAVQGREVYWLRRDREKSPFNNNQIEKALGASATARNMTTIRKIVDKFQ